MQSAMRDPWWRTITLPGQFVLAGIVVMSLAMFAVGSWVSSRIEQVVVQNSAVAAALFMESFISPLGQELSVSDHLSAPAERALREIFDKTALGERVVSYKIWKAGGLVVQASDPEIVGHTFPPSEPLSRALKGEIAATYEDLNDNEDAGEAGLGIPLLEVYSPIREIWTGRVIGVAEFYERAEALESDLADAKRKSWLIVGSAFAASGVLLFGIVQAGGRTILRQRTQLQSQLAESQAMAETNIALRDRVVQASTRATAMMEQAVRRIGADLHDGPAQYLALAALKLDRAFPDGGGEKANDVRVSLEKALNELRGISRGLALPDLDRLGLHELLERAAAEHREQTGMIVLAPADPPAPLLNYAQKLCIYRFLQEALSNAHRHSGAKTASVTCQLDNNDLALSVGDDGCGFDPKRERKLRPDGGQGLLGLSDRAESLGGRLVIDSAPGAGAKLTLILRLEGVLPWPSA